MDRCPQEEEAGEKLPEMAAPPDLDLLRAALDDTRSALGAALAAAQSLPPPRRRRRPRPRPRPG